MSDRKFLKCHCTQCGGRIEFPAEGIGLTAPCPHCGWPTELVLEAPPQAPAGSRRSLKWIMAGAVILMAGALGVTGSFLAARHFAQKKRAARLALPAPRPNRTNAPTIPKAAPVPPAPPVALNGFAASAVKIERTAGSTLAYAVGTLKNETDKQRFGVKIEMDLLDREGNKIGEARDYKDLIEPNREWVFRASVLKKNAAAARITAVQEQL